MARKPRFNLPGMPQHVVQRGNNRQPCFYRQQDYRRYKAILEEEADAALEFLMVSRFELGSEGEPEAGATVTDLGECPRCRRSILEEGELCSRCDEAMAGMSV